MGQAETSIPREMTGTTLPPDVIHTSLEQFNDIVMVTQATGGGVLDARVLYVNPAFERITGYAAEEVLGRSAALLRGPGTSPAELERIGASLNERRPIRAELLNYRKDGSAFWIEIEATVVTSPSAGQDFFVFIERDVTDRKRAEDAHREQARATAALFGNLPGMAYRCLDDDKWTMEFVSAGCLDLTGFEPQALIENRDTSYEDLIDPEDRKGVRETVGRAVDGNEAFELTYRIRTKSGQIKWVWERGRAVPGPSGPSRRLEGFITDITERKLLESQLLQNQRLESVGTLAGGIAHDLNNVFAPIMMAGDLLADKADEESGPLLDVIAASAKRGAELVRQILLFARGMEGPRIAVSPASLFNEVRTFLDSTLPKSIRLSFQIAPDVAAIAGDPVQLHQVLLSLSVNARDAMPNGGKLSISASNAEVPASAPRPHPDAVPGSFVRIDVADTGTGIPDILKGQIFDPFFTTKGVGKGSGLGLSTARSIVKAHCGFITFVSSEGSGTTFSIFLPTAELALAPLSRGEPARSPTGPLPRGKGETILVVDDEESVRHIMKSTLESFGYRTVGASDGAEAVSLLRATPAHFSAALVDMQMPGLDGSKTIVAMRHIRPDLPIVAASGLATQENKEAAAASGVRHFLDKPFSVETLIRTVHAAMAKAPA